MDLFNIQTNSDLLSQLQNIQKANQKIAKAQEIISSGKSINKASDSPANYVAAKLQEAEIRNIDTQNKNLEREILAQETQSSRIDQSSDLLIEIDQLALQMDAPGITEDEKGAIQSQITQLTQSLENNLNNTEVNGSSLNLSSLGISQSDLDSLSSSGDVSGVRSQLNTGLNQLLQTGSSLGSSIITDQTTYEGNQVASINQKAALSSIQDADIISENINKTNSEIVQQAGYLGLKNSINSKKSIIDFFS